MLSSRKGEGWALKPTHILQEGEEVQQRKTTKKISGNMESARQAVQDKIKKLGRKPRTSKSWNEWKRKQKKKFPIW